MENETALIVGMIFMFFIFLFTNKRNEDAVRATNKRLRFGLLISTVIMCIPFWLLFGLLISAKSISNLIGIDLKYVIIGIIVCVLFIIAPVVFRGVYEPINKKIYDKEKKYRRSNTQKWTYYIFHKPATSFRMSMKLPPVSKWSALDPKAVKKYHIEMLDAPPSYIQILLLFLTYLITTGGLWICDYFNETSFLIYVNLIVMPFIINIIIISAISFIVFDFIEKWANIKLNELFKFLLVNLFYVLIVNGVISSIG